MGGGQLKYLTLTGSVNLIVNFNFSHRLAERKKEDYDQGKS